MSEIELSVILNLIIFIAVPFVGGLIATRLKIPRMIGYIVSGMILGVGIHGQSDSFLPLYGNAGLILLLFTVGLEVNIETLRRFGRKVTLIGMLQVSLTWALFVCATLAFGFSLAEAIILGFACALSSTALVSKYIQETGEENSLLGGMSLGILLLQDLAVIPFMIILSSITKDATVLSVIGAVGMSFLKSGIIIGLIFFLASKFVPIILSKVASLSRELLNLLTILFILLFVGMFTALGLSPAIAAFVAGILIGGTLEHYQIFSQMRPLRDIFTILFFVYLGATINMGELLPVLPKALLFALLVIVSKLIITFMIFVYFRFHSKTAISSGIFLAQIGEFAFVVLHQSQGAQLISQDTYLFGITSTLLTLAISPILMDHKNTLYLKLRGWTRAHTPSLEKFLMYRVDREPAHIDVLNIKNHVILCGYGRVGMYIGRALTMAQIPFIAIDYNYQRVEEQRKKGVNIIYGDPTDIDILDFAQAEYATALVSAVPDVFSQEMIILNAKRLNSKVTILTRVSLELHQKRMKDLGAEIVIQPEFEAALSIVKKVLIGFNVPENEIVGKIKRLKLEHGMV